MALLKFHSFILESSNESEQFIYNHISSTNPHTGARNAFSGIPSLKNYDWNTTPITILPTDTKINKKMLYPASKRDVKKYEKLYSKGSEFPPIVLVDNGREYLVFDGAHRLSAALALNVPIKAYIGVPK